MKKYELTQEQVEELSKTNHGKRKLKKWLPEAFETKLEVGKWYTSEYYLVYYLGNYKCNCIQLINGEWFNNMHHSLSGHLKSYRLATEEEVKEALINEAIKRGFKNVGELKIKNTYGCIRNGYRTITNDFYYDYISNTFQLDGAIIFEDGIWAEIVIEDIPTQEEIDRVINYLKNK